MSDRIELLHTLCVAVDLDPAETLFGAHVGLSSSDAIRPGVRFLDGLLIAFNPLRGRRLSAAAGAARAARVQDLDRAAAAVQSATAVADALERVIEWVDPRLSEWTLTSREARRVVFDDAPALIQRHRLRALGPDDRARLRTALVRDGDVSRVLVELFGMCAADVARALEALGQLRAVIDATEDATIAMEDDTFRRLLSADPRLAAALHGRIVAARRLERGGRFVAAAHSWSLLAQWARGATAAWLQAVHDAMSLRRELDGLRKAVATDETRHWAATLATQVSHVTSGIRNGLSGGDRGLVASITSARLALARAVLDHASKANWTEVRKAVGGSARLLTEVASTRNLAIPELAGLKLSPRRTLGLPQTDQLFRSISSIVEMYFSIVRDPNTRGHQRAIDTLPEGGTYVFPFGEHRGPFVVWRSATIVGSGSHFWSRHGPVFDVRSGHLTLRDMTLERGDPGLRVQVARSATWSLEAPSTS